MSKRIPRQPSLSSFLINKSSKNNADEDINENK